MSVGIIVQGMAKDHEKVVETSFKEVAEKNNYTFKRTEDGAIITMCNLGDVYVTLGKHGKIILDSSTSMLGAGFHHEVCLFMEKLLPFMGNVIVQDESGYYADRDFEKLHKEHFLKYLKQIIEELTKNIDAKELASGKQYGMRLVHWDINKYTPATINNCIATPYGRFSYKQILEIKEKENYEDFAKMFYIWNKIEKDAYYYRNAALNIMWDSLHYFKSARYMQEMAMSKEVVMLLEEAVKLDSSIAFPKKEYLEICELAGHKAIDVSALTNYTNSYEIGYRKDVIYHRYGNISVAVDGILLFEEFEQLTWYSADDDWKNIEVSGFATESKEKMQSEYNSLVENLKKQAVIENVMLANSDKAKASIAFIGQQEDYYLSLAVIAHDMQITTVIYKYKSRENHKWAVELLKKFKVL